MGKKAIKLPNELIAIKNEDKGFHEKWHSRRNLLNIPHPWRGVFLGPPNVGKTTTIKNIIIRAYPPFEEVYCIHCDAEYTKEWEDIGATMLPDIPAPTEFDGERKTLVIIDDLGLKNLSKDQLSNLDRLFGFVSTHKNVSVALTAQDAFNIVPCVRRCSNLWVLWRIRDLDSAMCLARKAGIKKDEFNEIFDTYVKEKHHSLWIDHTTNSPAPLRINGFEVLDEE
jgi:DNA polymerase III delta prime subunit